MPFGYQSSTKPGSAQLEVPTRIRPAIPSRYSYARRVKPGRVKTKMKRLLIPLVIVVVGALLCLRASVNATYSSDYVGSSLGVNRTGDAVQALAELDFKRFFATQPAIGPVSVVVRAPFAAVAGIGHDLARLPARYRGAPTIVIPTRVFQSQ